MLRTLLVVCFLVSGGQCQHHVYVSDIEEYTGIVNNYQNYDNYDNYDYQHDYANIEFPSINLSNVTLNKCQCQGEEVLLDNGECKPYKTFIMVLLMPDWIQVPANTSDIGHIKVGKLQCPPNQTKVKRPSHQFSVLEDSHLLDLGLEYVYEDYCIEHLLDQNNELTREAYGCIKSPELHMCCSNTEMLNSTYDCVPIHGKNTPPPLYLEDKSQHFSTIEASNVSMLECSAEEGKLTKLILDGKSGVLNYRPVTPFLLWQSPIGTFEQSSNYCVTKEETVDGDLQDIAFVCYMNPLEHHHQKCTNATCIRKCCPEGKIYDYNIGGCQIPVNETDLWKPDYHIYDYDGLKPGAPEPEYLVLVDGFPVCSTEMFPIEPNKNPKDKFHLLQNGSMHVPLYKNSFDSIHYCIDNFKLMETEELQIVTQALLCFHKETEKCPIIHDILQPIFQLISAIFLAIVMIVYISIPELHAKVHGKCLVSYSFSLLLAFVLLVMVKFPTMHVSNVACKTMASVMHISFLAAFFWLNVMCFDIWLTIKSMRTCAESSDESRRRFCIYSLYAWGCPSIIGIVAIIVNELPEDVGVLRPGFSDPSCWFNVSGKAAVWVYFYGFILILIVLNIIFFCHVLYILVITQREIYSVLNCTKKQERERVWLYVKLLFVMGIPWVAEIISWHDKYNISCWRWFFTDVFISLQGFYIFIIFICKANMLKKIRNQWTPHLRKFKNALGCTPGFCTLFQRMRGRGGQGSVVAGSTCSQTLQTSVTGLSMKELPISFLSSQDMEADTVSDKYRNNIAEDKDNP